MLPFGRKASPSCIARAIVVNDRVALLAGSNPAIDRLSVRFPFSRTTSSSVPRGISIVGVSRILGTSNPGWLWSRGVGFAIRYPRYGRPASEGLDPAYSPMRIRRLGERPSAVRKLR
jgi:hypothetical protein